MAPASASSARPLRIVTPTLRIVARRVRIGERRWRARGANARIVEETLKECLPVATLVFVPPWVEDPYNFQTPFYHSSEIFAYATKALSKKLAAMGLDPAMLGDPAPA